MPSTKLTRRIHSRLTLAFLSTFLLCGHGWSPARTPAPRPPILLPSVPYWQEFDTLEGIDDSFAERQWMLPSIVERALVDGDTSVDPHQLLSHLDMSTATREEAIRGLEETDAVQTFPAVLTRDECYALQTYLLEHVEEELGIDNVDRCADWQVNIDEAKFVDLVGADALDRLCRLPSLLESKPIPPFRRVGIFLRAYERSPSGRPWMPFHSDGNAWTCNVALCDDADFGGGRLLALTGGRLREIGRGRGDATCHRGRVYHAVSAMKRGRRFSLIVFFHA